jgi:hypothetical protein
MKMICPCCNKGFDYRIAHDGRIIVGSVVWYYGKMIVAQENLYAGERAQDTRYRARTSLEMLNRDMLPFLPAAEPKTYMLGQ